jgi:hypothetical protein
MPLQFSYFEICHYNFSYIRILPFYTYFMCLGPLSECIHVHIFRMHENTHSASLPPLNDVWTPLVTFFFYLQPSFSFKHFTIHGRTRRRRGPLAPTSPPGPTPPTPRSRTSAPLPPRSPPPAPIELHRAASPSNFTSPLTPPCSVGTSCPCAVGPMSTSTATASAWPAVAAACRTVLPRGHARPAPQAPAASPPRSPLSRPPHAAAPTAAASPASAARWSW